MSTRAALDQACTDLAVGKLPDESGRRLVVQAVQTLMCAASPVRDGFLRRESKAERDRLLIELAREHCADLRGVKSKADRIAAWARRYEGSSWARERHLTACPDRLQGRPQGLVWRILKAHPDFPRDRLLREIISRADV